MKTILLSTTIILGIFLFSSFNNETGKKKVKSDNYIVPENGEDTIWVKGEVTMDAQFMTYQDMKGKSQRMAQSKVSYMVVAGRHFKNLPIFSFGWKRLHEVIATNKTSVLTVYFSNGYYLYIWDRQFEPKEKKVDVVVTQHWQNRIMKKYIMKYFPTCTEMIAFMQDNIDKDKLFTEGVEDYQCVSAEPKGDE
jgi:hypothetical protein